MTRWIILAFILILGYMALLPMLADAEGVTVTAKVRWNNENYFTTPHPKPVSFETTETGYVALLEDGTELVATWWSPELLQFQMEDAWWFICKGEFVNTLTALSACIHDIEI